MYSLQCSRKSSATSSTGARNRNRHSRQRIRTTFTISTIMRPAINRIRMLATTASSISVRRILCIRRIRRPLPATEVMFGHDRSIRMRTAANRIGRTAQSRTNGPSSSSSSTSIRPSTISISIAMRQRRPMMAATLWWVRADRTMSSQRRRHSRVKLAAVHSCCSVASQRCRRFRALAATVGHRTE